MKKQLVQSMLSIWAKIVKPFSLNRIYPRALGSIIYKYFYANLRCAAFVNSDWLKKIDDPIKMLEISIV